MVIHLDVFLIDLAVIRALTWFRFVLGIVALLFIPAVLYLRYLRADRLEPRFAKERAFTLFYLGFAVSVFANGLGPLLDDLRFPQWVVSDVATSNWC